MRARLLPSVIAALVLSVSALAEAHFDLIEPVPADSATDGGKGAPPCGPTTASGVINTMQDGKPIQGGHLLRVSVNETVIHPGHYRIALSINSRSEIPMDPAVVVQNGNSVSGAFENPAVFPVLADDVFDHAGGTAVLMFHTNVMLPNITCAKCTLQVIEFMAQHPLNQGGGYYYHHCADLKITADPTLPAADGGVTQPAKDAGTSGTDATGAGGGTGGSASDAGSAGPGTAGTTGTAGSSSTGAAGSSANTAGTTGNGGSATGTTGAAGNTGSGGATVGTAGRTGGGGTIATTGAAGTTGNAGSSGGSGCATGGGRGKAGGVGSLLVLAILWGRRRRRR